MKKKINIKDLTINIVNENNEDYICLTDMISAKDWNFFITDWLRNINTLEFLSAWEEMNNPNFNYGEYAIIRNKAGLNSFKVSIKEWREKTNAIWIIAKSWRYGWTYAHKDIAFEFGTWISPKFKLYLITEYQRLKEIENNSYNLDWNVNRILASVNYRHHTDAIKDFIIPKSILPKNKQWLHYAEEADLLNVAVWWYTAKDWAEANPKLVKSGINQRDYASINELIVISRLEILNNEMIKSNKTKEERFEYMKKIAKEMLEKLKNIDFIKSVKKLNDETYYKLGNIDNNK